MPPLPFILLMVFLARLVVSGPIVDVRYGLYEGILDLGHSINIFKGIRYAAAPVGPLRWKAPRPPKIERSYVQNASNFSARCPQAPSVLSFTEGPGYVGDEDCLFLNVYSPSNASNLPVFVFEHGGGYGCGDGTYSPLDLMAANNNAFISVIPQYRLGAFGFLSSPEVHQQGDLNVGLLDQRFAFQWVQDNIEQFGGDPSRVTIGGQSAGGGSVMLHAVSQSHASHPPLFTGVIASSPYLPGQAKFHDIKVIEKYYRFAAAVGCLDPKSISIFECLQTRDTQELQRANYIMTQQAPFGSWAFTPVTDNHYININPYSTGARNIQGVRVLTGNTAVEGPFFTPETIKTAADYRHFLVSHFTHFTCNDFKEHSILYPPASCTLKTPFASSGNGNPSALETSSYAVGYQQLAYAVTDEMAFTCPSYYLAGIFADGGLPAYKYQYSRTAAHHASDLFVLGFLPSPAEMHITEDLRLELQRAWGNFILGKSPGWDSYTNKNPVMYNFNTTGGESSLYTISNYTAVISSGNVTMASRVVNAREWEGNRGKRCDFWERVRSRPYLETDIGSGW